jgi:hypothetical protein
MRVCGNEQSEIAGIAARFWQGNRHLPLHGSRINKSYSAYPLTCLMPRLAQAGTPSSNSSKPPRAILSASRSVPGA